MSNIIQFPTIEQPPADDNPVDATTAALLDQVAKYQSYDFTTEWERAVAFLTKKGFNIDKVLQHEVTLADLGVGIAIARHLADDRVGAFSLSSIQRDLLQKQQDTTRLLYIPEKTRGYVWTLDYNQWANASSLVRLRLGRIIDRPLEQFYLLDI